MFKKMHYIYFCALVPFLILFSLFLYQMEIKLTSQEVHIQNGCNQNYASFIRDTNDDDRKLSFCDKWNKNKITLRSEYVNVKGKKYLSFDYIGFPDDKDITIFIKDELGHTHKIKGLKHTSEKWTNKAIEIPSNFKGKVSLIADDQSVSSYGWIGIGSIYVTNIAEEVMLHEYIKTILFILIFSFFLSSIFGFFLNKYRVLHAYIYMTLFLGLSSYLAFNAYLITLELGYIVSVLFFLFVLYSFVNMQSKNYKHAIWLFISLTSIISIIFFLAYSNFPHQSHYAVLSADKWHHFPVDNWLPKIFGDAILRGHVDSPMVGDWLSSDRPPLQTGLFLLLGSFLPTDLLYLVVSVGAQLLVILFIILLLDEIFDDKKLVFLITLLIFFNGFVFTNGLFVWPKLFSAVYQGIAFYYLYKIWISNEIPREYFIIFGIASILAFLTHGGSIFYLLSLSILILFALKNKKDILNLMYGFISAIVLYIPWLIYQKFIDPPGDRLLKWHLTNQHKITDESFLTVLIKYYHNLTLSEWIELKIAHITRIFTSIYTDILHIFSTPKNIVLDNIFFSIEYSYLFFSIAFVFFYWFAKAKLQNNNIFIRLILGSFFLYLILWVLILVSGTVIHQGAHFGWFSGFIGITIIVYHIHKYLFYLLASLNIALFLKIYVVDYLFDKDTISSSICIIMTFVFIVNLRNHLATSKI